MRDGDESDSHILFAMDQQHLRVSPAYGFDGTGLIRIKAGKGGVDRDALRSPRMPAILRASWRIQRPATWLDTSLP